MARISVILLAAGQSKRMGKVNKLFVEIDGKPMLECTLENIIAASPDEIILVSSEVSMQQVAQFEKLGVEMVDNPLYKTGMTSSIQAGVRVAKGDAYMVCLGDQPYIRTETYRLLMEAWKQSPEGSIIQPIHKGRHGNPVIFSKSHRGSILAHHEPEGCKGIVQSNENLVVRVEVDDPGIHVDFDRPEDFTDLPQC